MLGLYSLCIVLAENPLVDKSSVSEDSAKMPPLLESFPSCLSLCKGPKALFH